LTRAKQANESSETDPKESKHGEDLYQNEGGGDKSYAIDFKGGQNFGERQLPELVSKLSATRKLSLAATSLKAGLARSRLILLI
jgi:hypothetical protein